MIWFKRLFSLITYCALFGLGWALGSALLSTDCDDILSSDERFDAIVVLSGSLVDHGIIGPDTAERTDAGIELFRHGVAPKILMTGGVTENRVHTAAAIQMGDRAVAAGIPTDKILIENGSRSTLENARNSSELLGDMDQVLLVSDGYHLWRAWISFEWAGVHVAGACKSTSFRPDGPEMSARLIVREALALWFNLGRAITWSAADMLDVTPHLGGDFLH